MDYYYHLQELHISYIKKGNNQNISKKLFDLRKDNDFVYSITIDENEIICLVTKEEYTNDPRVYIQYILTGLSVEDDYNDEYIRAEKISDGINNKFSFESSYMIAILTVYMMGYDIDTIYDNLDINLDRDAFESKLKEMESEVKNNSKVDKDNNFI